MPFAGGALSEVGVAEADLMVLVPQGVDVIDAASAGICGITALGSLVRGKTGQGSKVFIYGGSGGTGVMGEVALSTSVALCLH